MRIAAVLALTASLVASAAAAAPAPAVGGRAALPGRPMRGCAVAGDLVVQGVTRVVGRRERAVTVGLDRRSGAVLWSTEVGTHGVHAAPAIVGDVVVHGGFRGDVVALDAKTGAVRWRFDTGGGGLMSTPIARAGAVWVGFIGGVAALDTVTGAARARIRTDAAAHVMTVDDDRVIFHDAAGNAIVAVDARTSVEQWRLGGPAIDRARGVHAGFQPERTADDGRVVFVPTNVAETWAVEKATGRKLWGYEPGGSTFGTALDGDAVFLSSETTDKGSFVARVDAATGVQSWRVAVPGLIQATPLVVGDAVVVPTERAGVLVLGRGDGERRAVVRGAATWWDACAQDDVVYVGDDKKGLRAIRIAR